MAERVIAELTRTGGFAGRPVRARLDSQTLAPEEAARLIALLDGVDLDASPPAEPPPPGAADLFRYALTVRRGDRRWVVTLVESQVPADLRPLIQYLSAAARPDPTG